MTITLTKAKLAIAVLAVVMLVPATAVALHTTGHANFFDDVPDEKFYADATEWAKTNDITTGSPAGSKTFKPDDNVTRGETVTFMKRYDDNIVQPALEGLEASVSNLPGVFWAVFNADATLSRSNTVASATTLPGFPGVYEIAMSAAGDPTNCSFTASVDGASLAAGETGTADVAISPLSSGRIAVRTFSSEGDFADLPFHLQVIC